MSDQVADRVSTLTLQLLFPFQMSVSCGSLMGAASS